MMTDTQLNRDDFSKAWCVALQEIWPNIDKDEAEYWLNDCLLSHVEFGDQHYDWSEASAQKIAKEYAEEFGEAAQ